MTELKLYLEDNIKEVNDGIEKQRKKIYRRQMAKWQMQILTSAMTII